MIVVIVLVVPMLLILLLHRHRELYVDSPTVELARSVSHSIAGISWAVKDHECHPIRST